MMKRLIIISVLVLAVVLVAAPAQIASGAIITSVDRANGTSGNRSPIGAFDGDTEPMATEPGGLTDGNIVFSDRDYPWVNTPADLVGAEYVRTFNTDKGGTGSETATYTVTTGMTALVGVTVDDRWLTEGGIDLQTIADQIVAAFAPPGTFTDTGLDLYIREKADGTRDRPTSVFAAVLPAGTYVFGPLQGNFNHYIIGAVPEPATIALLGLGGLALLRKRR